MRKKNKNKTIVYHGFELIHLGDLRSRLFENNMIRSPTKKQVNHVAKLFHLPFYTKPAVHFVKI